MRLGEYVRARRIAAGMSQEKFAQLVGLSAPMICMIENGYQTGLSKTARALIAWDADIVRFFLPDAISQAITQTAEDKPCAGE